MKITTYLPFTQIYLSFILIEGATLISYTLLAKLSSSLLV